MRASCIRSCSRILRTSRRMVLRSSMKSTSSISATASVTTWASLLTLSRLKRTAGSPSENGFVFLRQFGLHLSKHFLVIRARPVHFVGVGLKNHPDFVVNAVLKRQFIEQRRMHLFIEGGYCLGLDQTTRNQFLGDFAGQIAHIFLGEEHVCVKEKFSTSMEVAGRGWQAAERASESARALKSREVLYLPTATCDLPPVTRCRPLKP